MPVLIRFLIVLVSLTTAAGAEQHPNVILIVTDDQGYGDFGFTGNPVIQTPRLDALAAESAQLNTFYVSPVCSPTRANLMTGRFNYRTRCIDTFKGRSMMEPDEFTVAEALRESGYTTGLFGKWRLGDCYPMRPQDQGFDEVLMHRGGGLAQGSEPIENDRRYTDAILFRNGQQVPTKGYCTDVYFDAAIEWFEKQANEKTPFFAYLPTNAPHGPYHDVPRQLLDEYLGKLDELAELVRPPAKPNPKHLDTLARIAAMITNIDENVGKLIDSLENAGIKENTIVMFLVDNGPNTPRYAGPFRGSKSQVHEGGIRSPFLFHWPNRLNASNRFDRVCAHYDVMPTILSACGVSTPKNLDGRSFLAALEGTDTSWPERHVVVQAHRGDEPTKFHNFMLRRGNWKLLNGSGFGREQPETMNFELYDLEADPGETTNLVHAQSRIFDELKAAYEAWFSNVSSTRPDNYRRPAITLNVKRENPVVLTGQDLHEEGWRIVLDATATFEVTVVAPASFDAAKVIFRGGGAEELFPAEFSSRKAKIPAVDLAAGDYDLEVLLEDAAGKLRPAYQVELKR